MSAMSANTRLGPVMLDLEGPELGADDIRRLRHPATGGVILFSRNLESVSQVQQLVAAVRAQRPQLLLAIDQEGGRVQRLRQGVTRLPALGALGQHYDRDPAGALVAAQDWGWLMAAEMLALGLDFSFAPVLDLEVGRSAVIGDRAFHGDPAVVTTLAAAYIDGMHEAGMAATGKHFPGHGWARADSHVAVPEDERPLAQIQQQDLVPFTRLSARLDAVMPAHVIYQAVDSRPAGFSRLWLQQQLRQGLNFNGVIFSDDLNMAGAAVAGDYAQRARAALEAGCDMALLCNNAAGADQVLDWLGAEPQWPDPRRLAPMAARQRLEWDALWQSQRYQQVRQAIEAQTGAQQ